VTRTFGAGTSTLVSLASLVPVTVFRPQRCRETQAENRDCHPLAVPFSARALHLTEVLPRIEVLI